MQNDKHPSPIIDRRKQFFFWLGVFVLPPFWSWFTLAKGFSVRERIAAFSWLGVFVAWLLRQQDGLVGQWHIVVLTYPAILGWLTAALFVWLLFRIGFVPFTIIEVIVLIDILAVIQPSVWFVDRVGQPFELSWIVPLLVVCLLHLALEPLDRLRK